MTLLRVKGSSPARATATQELGISLANYSQRLVPTSGLPMRSNSTTLSPQSMSTNARPSGPKQRIESRNRIMKLVDADWKDITDLAQQLVRRAIPQPGCHRVSYFLDSLVQSVSLKISLRILFGVDCGPYFSS